MSLELTKKIDGELSSKASELLDLVLKISTKNGSEGLRDTSKQLLILNNPELISDIKSLTKELQDEIDQTNSKNDSEYYKEEEERKQRVAKFIEGNQEVTDQYIAYLSSDDNDKIEETVDDIALYFPKEKTIKEEKICNLFKKLVEKRTLRGFLERYVIEVLINNVSDGPAFLISLILDKNYPYALEKLAKFGKDDDVIYQKMFYDLLAGKLEFNSRLFEVFKLKIQEEHSLSKSVINILKHVYQHNLYEKSDCINLFIRPANACFFNEVMDYYYSNHLSDYKKRDLLSFFIKVYDPNEKMAFQFLDEIKSLSKELPSYTLEMLCDLHSINPILDLRKEIFNILKVVDPKEYHELAKTVSQSNVMNLENYLMMYWPDRNKRDAFIQELKNVRIPYEQIFNDLAYLDIFDGQLEDDFLLKAEERFLEYGYQKKAHFIIEDLPMFDLIAEKHGIARLDYSYLISNVFSLAESDIECNIICDLAYELEEDYYRFIVVFEVNNITYITTLTCGHLLEYYDLDSVLEICNAILEKQSITKTFFRLPTDGDIPVVYADRKGFETYSKKYELSFE
ncbi:hypothetical protein [Flammeovirga aprica]|uniref:Uncharacterized protein n=1 Tax=Flammeovirga aprica JL-4 TaxID=694437 RepID=A0A7X9P2F2_9BACT|nr:hypothetical protein [Flammeovirga aprica]NME67933.1 hypothetical protein [Flammeovirga aprica JL-4]